MPRPALSRAVPSLWARVESRPSLTSTTRRTRPLPDSFSARSPCESAGAMLVPPPATMFCTRESSSRRTLPTRASGWMTSLSLE